MICVLPGCHNTVDTIGDTCTDCLAVFGDWLQPTPNRLSLSEIRARDEYVERAYHTQRSMR